MIPGLSTARLVGYGLALAAIAGAVWWLAATIKKANERDQAIAERKQVEGEFAGYRELVQTSAIRYVAQLERDAGGDRELAQKLEQLETENAHLRWLASLPPAVVEVSDENGKPSARIAADWWLCLSTLVSRDAADIAACEARAGARGLRDAVSP